MIYYDLLRCIMNLCGKILKEKVIWSDRPQKSTIFVHAMQVINDTCYTWSPKTAVFYICLIFFKLDRLLKIWGALTPLFPSLDKLSKNRPSDFWCIVYQQILMKFGIMYSRYPFKNGCSGVHIFHSLLFGFGGWSMFYRKSESKVCVQWRRE